MSQTAGKKGKRKRPHQFTDPYKAARRNLKREIVKTDKKLRHWTKRGMLPSRECYLGLLKHKENLQELLKVAEKAYKADLKAGKKSDLK
jgi:hypothetical protein